MWVVLHPLRRRRSAQDSSLFGIIIRDCSPRLVTRTETAEYDISQLPAGSTCQVETFTIDDQTDIHINTTEYENPCEDHITSDRFVCILTATVRC